jgi:hypothetical protein
MSTIVRTSGTLSILGHAIPVLTGDAELQIPDTGGEFVVLVFPFDDTHLVIDGEIWLETICSQVGNGAAHSYPR